MVLCSAVLIATTSFGRDQSIYAVVGRGIVEGQLPYRDLWDFKPPGIFFVYALGEVLFGRSMAAPRILEGCGLVGMALTMAWLGRRWFGSATAGMLGAAIAAIVHVLLDFWHSGQPETFGGMLTIFALAVSVQNQGERPGAARNAFLVGLLLGAAALQKPPLGGCLVVVAAHRLNKQAARPWGARLWDLAALALGALLVLGGTLLWFWARGGLPDLVWTLRDFVPGYTKLGWNSDAQPLEMFYFAVVEAVTRFSPLIAVGLVACAILFPLASEEREGALLLLGCAAVQLAGVAMQAKFFQYHYAATVPVLALLAGAGWTKLLRAANLRGVSARLGLALLVLGLLVARKPVNDVPFRALGRAEIRARYLFGALSRPEMDRLLHRAADYDLGANRQVADYIRYHTRPDDTVLVFGFEPAIYWLSERKPATRFIYNVPQRSRWQTDTSQRLMAEEVEKNRPSYIIVQHNDVFPGVTGRATDSHTDLASFPRLAELLDRSYRWVTRIEDFDLHVRRGEDGH